MPKLIVRRDVEHLHRGARMHVLARAERVDEHLVLRKVCQHAQLDLRVVGAHDAHFLRRGERAANRFAELGAHRDVLQVRIVRRNTPRRRDRLAPLAVNAPGRGVHEHRQRIDVRSLELGELPVLEQNARERVVLGELLEHVGVR
jgi:hypothetical protein